MLFDRCLVFALVENFFEEIAPLRCFGFLHEPTFMQQLEMGSDEKDPLLYAVCALATKATGRRELWDAGSDWAEKGTRDGTRCRRRLQCTHNLKCIVLLHENAARIVCLSLCFVFSGLAARFCQALQLNVECDFDIMSTTSRRRKRLAEG